MFKCLKWPRLIYSGDGKASFSDQLLVVLVLYGVLRASNYIFPMAPFPLGVFVLARGFFFNVFDQFYFYRFLRSRTTFFLPASFLAFVFHPRATKNTPNGKRALELIFYFVTEDYIYRFLGVNSWFEWNKSITKSLLLLPTVLPISLWKRPSRLRLT